MSPSPSATKRSRSEGTAIMSRATRAALTAFIGVLAIVAFAANASASNLSVNETRFDWKWAETTTTKLALRWSGVEIKCPLTLRGAFEASTFAKVTRPAIARIAETVENPLGCTGGSFRPFATTLRWEVRYEGFTGRLPNINSVTVQLISGGFELIRPRACNFEFESGRPLRLTITREGSGGLGEITPDSTSAISSSSEALCRIENARFSVAGEMTRRGMTTRVLLTLIT